MQARAGAAVEEATAVWADPVAARRGAAGCTGQQAAPEERTSAAELPAAAAVAALDIQSVMCWHRDTLLTSNTCSHGKVRVRTGTSNGCTAQTNVLASNGVSDCAGDSCCAGLKRPATETKCFKKASVPEAGRRGRRSSPVQPQAGARARAGSPSAPVCQTLHRGATLRHAYSNAGRRAR